MNERKLILWGIFGILTFLNAGIIIFVKPINLHNLIFGIWSISASSLFLVAENDFKNYLNNKPENVYGRSIWTGIILLIIGLVCLIRFIKELI